MTNTNGEFKGSTKQAILDIQDRLDRIESKLDRVIEKNIIFAALISGGVSIVGLLFAYAK